MDQYSWAQGLSVSFVPLPAFRLPRKESDASGKTKADLPPSFLPSFLFSHTLLLSNNYARLASILRLYASPASFAVVQPPPRPSSSPPHLPTRPPLLLAILRISSTSRILHISSTWELLNLKHRIRSVMELWDRSPSTSRFNLLFPPSARSPSRTSDTTHSPTATATHHETEEISLRSLQSSSVLSQPSTLERKDR